MFARGVGNGPVHGRCHHLIWTLLVVPGGGRLTPLLESRGVEPVTRARAGPLSGALSVYCRRL